jgi:hypothetical protein
MVQMIVVTGCDDEGQGGTVLDSPKVIMPDGKLNEVMAALDAAYGRHKIDNPDFDSNQDESEQNPKMIPVSAARNLTYRIRMFVTDHWVSYGKSLAETAARNAALQQIAQSTAQLQIKE